MKKTEEELNISPDIRPEVFHNIKKIDELRNRESVRETPILEAIHLKKKFGDQTVIPDLNFRIDDVSDMPEIIGILGPSGCGKSTILNLVAGLIMPTDGEIKCNGKAITGPGQDRGMIFQKYSSFPFLKVIDNIAYPLIRVKKMKKKEAHEQAKYWLDRMYLSGAEYKYPSQLSGGMQQRVAIARTLCMNAKIILMDEPFGALDRKIRWEMQDLMADLLFINPVQEITVLLVTHDIPEAVYLSDKIWVINKGGIEYSGNVERPSVEAREIQKDRNFMDMVNFYNDKIFSLELKNREDSKGESTDE